MKKNKVFFIAEAGINHSGSIVKAKKLVNIAEKRNVLEMDCLRAHAKLNSSLL